MRKLSNQMKDSKNRKGLIVSLVMSLVANIILLAGIYYIGSVKTKFFRTIGTRMGICEMKAKDRGDYWCIRGWTNTLNKLDYDADVVFFGNSITCGGDFQNHFPNVKTCNLGYPGDNIDGMMLRIEQIKAVSPEKVFVMAGINGLSLQTEAVFESKYQIMVDSIKIAVPDAEIYLQSILPINHRMRDKTKGRKDIIKNANSIIKAIAQRSDCVYVDLWSLYEKDGEMPNELTRDGVHLFPKAYDRWMEAIRKYIE